MLWLVYALITALALSAADAVSKKALETSDDLVIVWVREGYALPFLAVGFFFVPVPALDAAFWITVAVLVPLEIAALVLYVRAIRVSPLSLSIPFTALSPVFIIFIAYVLLGERPGLPAVGGIMLIVIGAYLLNASSYKEGLTAPLKAILKEPGSVMMIIVAIIYSVTSTLGKIAVEHSSALFFGFFYSVILAIVLGVYVVIRGKTGQLFSRPRMYIAVGLCTAIMIITHFAAINLTQVAYLISIKRTSLVWSVLFGYFFFHEEKIKERLVGSIVMLAGAVVIIIF